MSATQVGLQAPILNSGHRCDRCGSRAYVVTVLRWSPTLMQGGELLFCAHHWKRHGDAIMPLVSVLIDERWTLTKHIADDKHLV